MKIQKRKSETLTLRLRNFASSFLLAKRLPDLEEPNQQLDGFGADHTHRQTDNLKSVERLSLLVVENDDLHWLSLKSWLPSYVDFHREIDGDGALNSLVKFRPDLILMDLEISLVDGIDALSEIRRLQTAANEDKSIAYALIKVEDADAITRIRKSGFDGILRKPVCHAEFEDVLRMVHSGIHSSGSKTDFWIERSFVETFPSYVESRRALIQEMVRADKAGEPAALRLAAHTLAGSPALHGFHQGISICRKIGERSEIAEHGEILMLAAHLKSFFDQPDVR